MNGQQSVSGPEEETHTRIHQSAACPAVVIHHDVLKRIDILIMRTESNVINNRKGFPKAVFPVVTNPASYPL